MSHEVEGAGLSSPGPHTQSVPNPVMTIGMIFESILVTRSMIFETVESRAAGSQ